MLLAHGTGICPLEILAVAPTLAAVWACRGMLITRFRALLGL
jgi:hypothetical protein